MLVIMAGLPATGKSRLARALAEATGGAVLDKDLIRAALFAPADVEYSAAQDDFIMDLMLQTARYLIEKDNARIVFLDGRTFSRAYQRNRAFEFAKALPTPWRVIECVCSEASARERLRLAALDRAHPAANRTIELWETVRNAFEGIADEKTVIGTDRPFGECVRAGRDAICPMAEEKP